MVLFWDAFLLLVVVMVLLFSLVVSVLPVGAASLLLILASWTPFTTTPYLGFEGKKWSGMVSHRLQRTIILATKIVFRSLGIALAKQYPTSVLCCKPRLLLTYSRTKDFIEVVIQLNETKGFLAVTTFHTDLLQVYPVIFVDPAKVQHLSCGLSFRFLFVRLHQKRFVCMFVYLLWHIVSGEGGSVLNIASSRRTDDKPPSVEPKSQLFSQVLNQARSA